MVRKYFFYINIVRTMKITQLKLLSLKLHIRNYAEITINDFHLFIRCSLDKI